MGPSGPRGSLGRFRRLINDEGFLASASGWVVLGSVVLCCVVLCCVVLCCVVLVGSRSE